MKKAVLAAVVTAFVGWFFTDWLSDLPEVGVVIAIAVMGAFIIYFNEKRSKLGYCCFLLEVLW